MVFLNKDYLGGGDSEVNQDLICFGLCEPFRKPLTLSEAMVIGLSDIAEVVAGSIFADRSRVS